MLKSLLGIALLTASNSVASFQQTTKNPENKIQIQCANESYNYTAYMDQVGTITNESNRNSITEKVNALSSGSDYVLINATFYEQKVEYNPRLDDYLTHDNTWAYIRNLNVTPTEDYWYSQSLLVLQITPYYPTFNNELEFRLLLNLNFNINPDQYSSWYDTGCLHQIYTSTQDYSTLLDRTTFGTTGWIAEQQAEFEDADLGYTYTYQEIDDDSLSQQGQVLGIYTNLDMPLYLTPNQVNYICIFSTPYGHDPNTQWAREVELVKTDSSGSLIQIIWNDFIFRGTAVIPPATVEVVDIPGLMYNIVAMPWYFISTAFNLTLFPGTQYQINIANLFIALIAVGVFIFLMRLLLKGIR